MHQLAKYSDEALVEIVRTSNKELYGELVRRYQKKLLRYAKYLAGDEQKASDVVQEAFIKAYSNIVHNQAMNQLQKFRKDLHCHCKIILRALKIKNTKTVSTQNQLCDIVMSAVESGKVQIKPKWQLVIASLVLFVGLVGVTIFSAFLFTVTIFLLRHHDPMGSWRLQQMIISFPLWIPVLGILCLGVGFVFLKQYDLSYKKNFPVIVLVFIVAIIASAVLIDRMGINETWSRGPMRRFYQQQQMIDN